jgi:hypothetical protein
MCTKNHLLIWGLFLLLAACSPSITRTISKSYAPLDYREEVLVLDLQTPVPAGADAMGSIKFGDTGFSTNCDWETVIEAAKAEARKVGGNAIKITKHRPPNFWGSSCHRITVTVLRIEDAAEIAAAAKAGDEAVADWDYALVHIYRPGGAGALVGYDVYLGNEVICRAKNKWKTTIQVRTFGRNTVWASTESKTELPVNFEPGREYYIRCGMKMGVMVGRPALTLVDRNTGKAEFEAIKTKTDEQ